MYLKRLEIQGFKSFARKTALDFLPPVSGRFSVTAIVGPNGAGKSNITDAIRWVMGETSLKAIRGKKSEDVIFSGSEQKGALGAAEVAMVLDNGEAKLLDFPEITITRRLYRSGESEYLINNSPARLIDVRLLFAKAQFAEGAYSIVSQGMIDRLLTVSSAERKDWFDEACGIKEHQIKQHQAELKLARTRENIQQAEILLNEVGPRLRLLSRQVKKLEQRQEVEVELRGAQETHYGALYRVNLREGAAANGQLKKIDGEYGAAFSRLEKIQNELSERAGAAGRQENFAKLHGEHQAAEREKNNLERQLAILAGQLQSSYRQSGQAQLGWLEDKISETRQRGQVLAQKLAAAGAEEKARQTQAARQGQAVKELAAQQAELKLKAVQLSTPSATLAPGENYFQLIGPAARRALSEINERFGRVAEISAVFQADDNRFAVRLASEARAELPEAKAEFLARLLVTDEAVGAEAAKELAELERRLGEAWALAAELGAAVAAGAQATAILTEEQASIEREQRRLERELTLAQASPEQFDAVLKKLAGEKERLQQAIAISEKQVSEFSARIAEFNAAEEAKQQLIFGLQKSMQNQQGLVNEILARRNEINIALARLETKREDLGREVRAELKISLEQLAGSAVGDALVGPAELMATIEKLKYQLNLIGGIDEEVVKEYGETKERHDFLIQQLTDLRAAMENLEQMIAELAELMKKKRAAAFKKIRQEFGRYFKILFDGGSADLEEVYGPPASASADSGEAMEATPEIGEELETTKVKDVLTGIEVTANPPGKKIKHLGALSGGERTLTSIALICAILHCNPSPFVVLDEVEAALDEANTLRFAKIMAELSTQSQFIVVTHNRVTMHAADVLYGVVMGSDGASKLLSVRLEDVAQFETVETAATTDASLEVVSEAV